MSAFDSDPQHTAVASRANGLSVVDLEHDAWQSSKPVYITRQWSGAAAPPERHAEVKLCWTDDGLFVRFVCEQHEPLVVSQKPNTDQKTLGLWDRDVCEIFIAPYVATPQGYFEFEAAPTGEWIDLGIQITESGRQTEWDYASGMKTASSIRPDLIVVMIFVPWSDRIPRPSPGDRWRVNLFRCVGSNEKTRYLAWRPTGTPEPNFHVPEAFGSLHFS